MEEEKLEHIPVAPSQELSTLTKDKLSKAIISLAKNDEFLELILDEIKKNQ